MRQVVGDKSALELLAELAILNEAQPDELQPGELTAAQWAEAWGRNRCAAERLLKSGVRSGRLSARSVLVRTNGHVRRAMVYREVEKKPQQVKVIPPKEPNPPPTVIGGRKKSSTDDAMDAIGRKNQNWIARFQP